MSDERHDALLNELERVLHGSATTPPPPRIGPPAKGDIWRFPGEPQLGTVWLVRAVDVDTVDLVAAHGFGIPGPVDVQLDDSPFGGLIVRRDHGVTVARRTFSAATYEGRVAEASASPWSEIPDPPDADAALLAEEPLYLDIRDAVSAARQHLIALDAELAEAGRPRRTPWLAIAVAAAGVVLALVTLLSDEPQPQGLTMRGGVSESLPLDFYCIERDGPRRIDASGVLRCSRAGALAAHPRPGDGPAFAVIRGRVGDTARSYEFAALEEGESSQPLRTPSGQPLDLYPLELATHALGRFPMVVVHGADATSVARAAALDPDEISALPRPRDWAMGPGVRGYTWMLEITR